MKTYDEQLLTEAVSVGALMVPWFFLVSGATSALGFRDNKDVIDLFLSGATFHLAAEFSGVNAWYLNNSAANLSQVRLWMNSGKNLIKKEKPCGPCFR
jgi:hypothetical protein